MKNQIMRGELQAFQQFIAVRAGKDDPRVATWIRGIGCEVMHVILMVKNNVTRSNRFVSNPCLSAHDIMKTVAEGDSVDKRIRGVAVMDAESQGLRG